jgi:hypothetical protein
MRKQNHSMQPVLSVGKYSNRVPSALKHGIYSGIGLLPTESPAKFRKFKKQIFAELNPVGRLEQDIVDEIVRLEWRRQNLFTYDLAEQTRARHRAIFSSVPSRYEEPFLLRLPEPRPHPDNPSPEEIEAARKRAHKRARNELEAAIELVELGDVVTAEHLEKGLAIRDRLDGMITRAYKKLLYVRGIKSMSSSSGAVSPQPLLGRAA